ncbi:unnamed protein product [Closterium sp. Naga37s-1]|nr:unnamed protein product [Closterium sp. Naga37s-1]
MQRSTALLALRSCSDRTAHPGGPLATNKAAALSRFLQRRLAASAEGGEGGERGALDPRLVEVAVRNAQATLVAGGGAVRHVDCFNDGKQGGGAEDSTGSLSGFDEPSEEQPKVKQRKRKGNGGGIASKGNKRKGNFQEKRKFGSANQTASCGTGEGEGILAELAALAGAGAAGRGGGDSMSATALLLGPLLLPGGTGGGVAATAASSTAAVALPLLDLLQLFLWVAVSPAVAEELLFRGLLLMTLQEKLGRINAAMLSAALFGLFHLSRTTLPPLLLSLLACLATTATVSGVYPDPYGIGESAAHKSHQPLPLAAHAALPPGLPRHNCHHVACLATIATLSGVNLDPYGIGVGKSAHHVLPLTLNLTAILGVGEVSGAFLSNPSLSKRVSPLIASAHDALPRFPSLIKSLIASYLPTFLFPSTSEIFQRIMARRYGVKISPPYLLPGPLGCHGTATGIESAGRAATAPCRLPEGWMNALFALFHLSLPSLFRGLLLTALMGADMLSAAFFALFHLSLSLLFPNMALGVAAGLLAGVNGQ